VQEHPREIDAQKTLGKKVADDDDKSDPDDEDAQQDLMFRVIIEKAEPAHVKLSRKNVAFITIEQSKEGASESEEHAKLLEFFMAKQKPSWGSQFKNAIILGPQISEENMIIDPVTCCEAFQHFLTIFWKLFFAMVPPVHWGQGYISFCVALGFIGGITAIVAEVASAMGCVMGLKDPVTAITFVALGTSLPDTFASINAC